MTHRDDEQALYDLLEKTADPSLETNETATHAAVDDGQPTRQPSALSKQVLQQVRESRQGMLSELLTHDGQPSGRDILSSPHESQSLSSGVTPQEAIKKLLG